MLTKWQAIQGLEAINTFISKEKVVGETGFEPATLCSQNRCATRLRYSPTHMARGQHAIREMCF